MNLFRYLSVLIFFCFASIIKAQYTNYPMLNVGYVYQNQSFGEFGGKVLLIKKDEVAFRLGASALLGNVYHKFTILPKAQADVLFNFRKNVDVHQGFYYVAGVETTTKYFSPYVGISALGILDFMGGYAISYPNQYLHGKELKGVNLSISLNLPLDIF